MKYPKDEIKLHHDKRFSTSFEKVRYRCDIISLHRVNVDEKLIKVKTSMCKTMPWFNNPRGHKSRYFLD